MPSMWTFGGLGWRQILKKLWQQFWKDRVLDQSAMLSFYFIFAVFPFLLFLVTMLGLVLQSGQALQNAIQKYFGTIAPASTSSLINSILEQISRGSSSSTLWLSLAFTLWFASSGVVATIEALNVAYEVKESRPWWKQRLLALVLTVGLALFLALALGLLGVGDRLPLAVMARLGPGTEWVNTAWRVVQWILVLAFVILGFNLLYFFAPNVGHRRWHWLMPGTLLGVGLWILISYGFKTYLSFFNTYNYTYGSIAAVIILLFWFYLSSIAILLGGELNSEIEKRTGQVQKPPGTAL